MEGLNQQIYKTIKTKIDLRALALSFMLVLMCFTITKYLRLGTPLTIILDFVCPICVTLIIWLIFLCSSVDEPILLS